MVAQSSCLWLVIRAVGGDILNWILKRRYKRKDIGMQPLNQGVAPEPSTYGLVLTGLLGLGGNLKRKYFS